MVVLPDVGQRCAEPPNPKSWGQELQNPKPLPDTEEGKQHGDESRLHLPNAVRIVVTAAAARPDDGGGSGEVPKAGLSTALP